MKRWMSNFMAFKILTLMYFSGGIIVYLLLDLVLFHTGSLSTITCLQILATTILLAASHYFLLEEHVSPKLSHKKWILVHVIVNYGLMLVLSLMFGWIPVFTFNNIALFTGIFAVIYLVLSFGFAVYYALLRFKMNDQLDKYKQA